MENKNLKILIENFQKSATQNKELTDSIISFQEILEKLDKSIYKVFDFININDIKSNSKDLVDNLKEINNLCKKVNTEYEKLSMIKTYNEETKNDLQNIKDKLTSLKKNTNEHFKITNENIHKERKIIENSHDKINEVNSKIHNMELNQLEILNKLNSMINSKIFEMSNITKNNDTESIKRGEICINYQDKLYFKNYFDDYNLYVCNKDLTDLNKLTTDLNIKDLVLKGSDIYFIEANKGNILRLDCIKDDIKKEITRGNCKSFKIVDDKLIFNTDIGIFLKEINTIEDTLICKCNCDRFDCFGEEIYFEENGILFKVNYTTKSMEQIM